MAISFRHAKVSAIPDVGDATLVEPSDWNAAHTLTMASGKVLGRLTAGNGTVEELAAREVLMADRTYYVLTTGSDSNTGLANTAGGAFLTGQKAWNVINATLDINGFIVTIQFGSGTFTGLITDYYGGTAGVGQRYVGGGYVKILGNGASNTTLTTSPAGWTIWMTANYVLVDNVKIAGALVSAWSSTIEFGTGVNFGTSTMEHMHASSGGQIRHTGGGYTISGNAISHFYASTTGQIRTQAATITLTGTPAFSIAFANADFGGIINAVATYSGSATGLKFSGGGQFITATNDLTLFPGDTAGTLAPPSGAYDSIGSERFGVVISGAGSITGPTLDLTVPVWAKKVIFGAFVTADTAVRRPIFRISTDGGSTYIATGYVTVGANVTGAFQGPSTTALIDMFTDVSDVRYWSIVAEIVFPFGPASVKADFYAYTDDNSAAVMGGKSIIALTAGQRVTNIRMLLNGTGNFDGFGYSFYGFG